MPPEANKQLIPTKDVKILNEIKGFESTVSVFVSEEGVMYFVEPSPSADNYQYALDAIKSILRLVSARYKTPVKHHVQVSQSDFALLGRGEKKPAARTVSAEQGTVTSEKVLGELINTAARQKGSDFFIDGRREEGLAYISYKTYGISARAGQMPYELAEKVVRKMWSKGGTGTWEPSKPTDTTFSYPAVVNGVEKELRLRGASVSESERGFTVSCRLRDPSEIIPLESAGYTEQQLNDINEMLRAPGGLILFSGPTDSGKSTSLTSAIDAMPHELRKIEIADPVEVYIDHCTHIQLDRSNKEGSEIFSEILSATVRMNPDVLILGEIRDKRTGLAAMSMAQQGKRVISTVHATTCAGVPPRLTDFGISPNLLGFRDFFAGSISQNLVGKLCLHCRRDATGNPSEDDRFEALFESQNLYFRNPEGCSKCQNGIKGQTLVAEVYPMCVADNQAYDFIRNESYSGYAEFMESSDLKVEAKHKVAARKILAGEIDPVLTERKIGSFRAARRWKEGG